MVDFADRLEASLAGREFAKLEAGVEHWFHKYAHLLREQGKTQLCTNCGHHTLKEQGCGFCGATDAAHENK